MRKTLIAAALCLAASGAMAQGPGYGYGYGPGMMGGYGPGMMGGYGPGYGGGPGMMGGYGPGYGGGPGMMGGYGPGMMGGYGPGMMRGYGLGSLELTQEQADKIAAIQEQVRRKNWDTMGQMRSEMFKLSRLYYADNADPKAVLEQQKKVDELHRQMLVSHLESRKQIDSVLTPEQRKQLKQFGPRWLEDEGR